MPRCFRVGGQSPKQLSIFTPSVKTQEHGLQNEVMITEKSTLAASKLFLALLLSRVPCHPSADSLYPTLRGKKTNPRRHQRKRYRTSATPAKIQTPPKKTTTTWPPNTRHPAPTTTESNKWNGRPILKATSNRELGGASTQTAAGVLGERAGNGTVSGIPRHRGLLRRRRQPQDEGRPLGNGLAGRCRRGGVAGVPWRSGSDGGRRIW